MLRPFDEMQCNFLRASRLHNVFGVGHLVRCAWTNTRNLSDLIAVSYVTTLSLGMPMIHSPAPIAPNPPTTAAPSSAPTTHATSGPATKTGPKPGTAKKADPNNIPHR